MLPPGAIEGIVLDPVVTTAFEALVIVAATETFASAPGPVTYCTVVDSCSVLPASYDGLSVVMDAVTETGIGLTVKFAVPRVTAEPVMLETSVAV